jgi:uncharacterized membrane protein required for colicin V production
MNWLDILLLVVLAGVTILGAIGGIIKAGTSMLGVGIGIYVAGKTYETTSTWFYFVHNETISKILGFVVILLLAVIIAAILAAVLSATLKKLNVKWVDHLLGGIAALITASLVIGAILTVILHSFPNIHVISESVLAELMLKTVPIVAVLLPDSLGSVKQLFL